MLLRPGLEGDGEAIRDLLADNRLPVADLASATIAFVVAVDGDGLTGVVGLERFGDVGLLRSLAVRERARGAGLGSRLVAAAEREARAAGLRELVLLTETAGPLFARLGYAAIPRDAAPAAARASAEFRSLCPASAVCMSKPVPEAEPNVAERA